MLKTTHIYYLTVSVDQKSRYGSDGVLCLVSYKAVSQSVRQGWILITSLTEERSISKLPQLVHRINFPVAVGFLVACFFKASHRKRKTLEKFTSKM